MEAILSSIIHQKLFKMKNRTKYRSKLEVKRIEKRNKMKVVLKKGEFRRKRKYLNVNY